MCMHLHIRGSMHMRTVSSPLSFSVLGSIQDFFFLIKGRIQRSFLYSCILSYSISLCSDSCQPSNQPWIFLLSTLSVSSKARCQCSLAVLPSFSLLVIYSSLLWHHLSKHANSVLRMVANLFGHDNTSLGLGFSSFAIPFRPSRKRSTWLALLSDTFQWALIPMR